MKLALFALAALTASGAHAATCSEAVQQNYVQAIDRFNVGEVTRTAVAQAQATSLMDRLACEAITKTQYCYEGYEVMKTLVEGMQVELSFGQRSNDDVLKALKAQALFTGYCAAN